LNAISIVGLAHTYQGNDRPALVDLNLEIPKGVFFGLLGPNGAGKTTAISMISGSIHPNSGTIKILEKNWKEDATFIRKRIGSVPQDIALYDSLTAPENLTFFGKMMGLNTKECENKVEFLMERFGLKEHSKKVVSKFSGGMKRRVNLMVALLHDPEILILDEPTVGVDVHSRHLINEYLKELNKGGMTMVYTSHQLEETEKMCDQIAIIDNGSMLASGRTKELLESVNATDLNSLFLELTGAGIRD